jgi:hypothetical protein
MEQRASERNHELRHDWLMQLAMFDANQLLFVDESAADERSKDRKYGWAPVGATPVLVAPITRSKRWSVLPVYTAEYGFMNWQLYKGSFDTKLFNNFVSKFVVPLTTEFPGKRSVLVMDNAPIHHSEVPCTRLPANISGIATDLR